MPQASLNKVLIVVLLVAGPVSAENLLVPLPAKQWDEQAVLHLLRRAAFEGTPPEIKKLSRLSATMPGFLLDTVEAAPAGSTNNGRILVMLQLAGGNDGLNTIVPYADDHYHRARPSIALQPNQVLKIDDHVGMHPAMTGLKELYDDGSLAIVQGVGYPNPNRSHFSSMDIWHTADPAGRRHTGWLGRYFDNCCKGPASPPPESGIALMPESPLAMMGDKFSPLTFQDEKRLVWNSKKSSPAARKLFAELNSGAAPATPDAKNKKKHRNEALDFLRRATLQARMGAAEVHAAAGKKVGSSPRGKGGSLQAQLSLVLKMIAADFPTSVYYVSMGGFDTHSNQTNRHRQLLTQFSDSLRAFMARLKEHKLADRVLLASFSEFGRRVVQNSSGGTDHGTAAPMFLIGSRVKPGLHQPHPALDRLDDGDLIHRCDFRRVYAALLRDWLGCQPQKVLGGSFNPLKVLA